MPRGEITGYDLGSIVAKGLGLHGKLSSYVGVLLTVICVHASAQELAGFDPVLPAVSEPKSKSLIGMRADSGASASVAFSVEAQWRPTAPLLPNYVGTVSISPGLLQPPATDQDIDLSKPFIGTRLPRQLSGLRLEIEGFAYSLAFQHQAADVAYGLRQVTMSVVGQPGAYARFSVDDANGLVVGTLYTPDTAYRLVPSTDNPEQHIYRVDVPQRELVPSLQPLARPRVALIERRHLQLEEVVRLQTLQALVVPKSRAMHLRGGKLGSMQSNVSGFKKTLGQLKALSRATGLETFEIASVTQLDQGQSRLQFYQTLNGVRVKAINEVLVDANGTVLEITAQLAAAPNTTGVRFTAKDALDFAKRQWERVAARPLSSIRVVDNPLLWYQPSPTLDNLRLIYELRFQANGEGDHYLATVDADTAEVTIVSTTRDLGSRVCGPYTLLSPANCPGGRTILWSTPPAPAVNCMPSRQPNNCNNDSKRVSQYMTDIDAKASAAGQTNPQHGCCNQMAAPRGYIDVYLESTETASNNGHFAGDGTIHLGYGTSYMPEVLAHEFMHGYIQYTNHALLGRQDRFTLAFQEGIGDAFAAVYGAASMAPGDFGQKWVYGDGAGYRPTSHGRVTREGRVDLSWSHVDSAPNAHNAGRVFFQFFRRLQAQSGVSDLRLLGIILGTAASLRDLDADGRIDASDFARAVLATIKPTETQLINAVNSVYGAMHNSSGSLPPPAAYSAEADRLFRRNVTGYSAEAALAGFSTLAGHDRSRFRGLRWS